MKKIVCILAFCPMLAWGVPAVVSGPSDPCTVGAALNVLIPGAQWTLQNNDYATFAFVGSSTFTAPSPPAVTAQIASCHATQTTNKANFQNDLTTINSSTPTVLESAILDILNQKGVLTPP